MKILIVLNYYWPYISGLSECARSLAEELAKDHDVTVLTSKHKKDLAGFETINGVKVIRKNILFHISKGYISPSFIFSFMALKKNADVVNLHLPMAEAGLFGRLTPERKLVLTYHCDINLSPSLFGRLITKAMDLSSVVSLKKASSIVVSSKDYARYSRILPRYEDKLQEIHPTSPFYKEISNQTKTDVSNYINIGFCGRIVEEKGIDILLKAAPIVKKSIPNARFLIAGDYKAVAGGSVYDKLKETIGWDESYVTFLGKLTQRQLKDFYNSLDLFVLPSINSLEAFGMVQVEAMLSGVPVVASNLPGVREIVRQTGMGRIVEVSNVEALAAGIIDVILNKEVYIKERTVVEERFGIESAVKKYIALFQKNQNI